MTYVELHGRSAFHFLRGAVQPKVLAAAMADADIAAGACVDANGVYGSPAFEFACADLGIAGIVGSELTIAREAHHTWMAGPFLGRLPLLVESCAGYQNLCQLITQMHLRWSKSKRTNDPNDEFSAPSLALQEIDAYKDGLIALTGDADGPLGVAWRAGGTSAVKQAMLELLKVFPRNQIYVEIQRHRRRDEDVYNRMLCELAEQHRLKVLATNGPAYATPTGRQALDVFTCLRYHTTIEQAGRLLESNAERHVKGDSEMRILFADLPQAIDESGRLAERLQFRLRDLGYAFPLFPVPAGESLDSFLKKMALFGAQSRYGCITRRIRQQMEHELAIIKKLGFAGYFLIVWDIVNYCRENGILAQGRGSAANSVICYALGITAVDPIQRELLFERFLSEERQGWPDIDIDLPSGDLRESVIQEVYRRYGQHGAAMTANVICYRGRSAMREIGKVLSLPQDVVDRFNTLFARGDYKHTLGAKEQLRQAGIEINHPRHQSALRVYNEIIGLPRHLGQHSGGMIICNNRLNQVVPLENASMPGRVVAQWDKDACEDLGIIKIDLLGLGMMAVLQDCIELTHQRGHGIDLAQIPQDDAPTYDLLCRAETMGVFQVESRAQMATLPRMKPRKFYDLAVEVAIIRPGPIAGELANPYLNRRNGLEPIIYIDERLEPVLKRTLGIPLFQEQVLKMAMVMADYTPGESEELRRALGFTRNQERIDQAKATFRAKLEARNLEPEKVDWLVDTISSFALYGFPESHAISFALLAYASAWLKVHRPEEFYCSLLNNQPMGFYSPASLVQEARRFGLRFLPPDVMHSGWKCLIDESSLSENGKASIRLGLNLVKGVSASGVDHLLSERNQHTFSSLESFRLRNRFNVDELRALAAAGALNALAGSRRQAMWRIESPLEDDLFGRFEAAQMDQRAVDTSPLEEMTQWERICYDFETVGLTVGEHPMQKLRPRIRTRSKIWRAADLPDARNNQRLSVAGAVICRQRPGTAKGVVFISLEDETGISNCIVWPGIFEKLRLMISAEPYLIITGKIQKSQGTIHIITSNIQPVPIDDAPAGASHDFH
ncbi:MAG: error-prone DNA polymerase [Verrucomicrobiota bacterium]